MTHPLVYELNTRCWLRHLSARWKQAVTLGSVPDAEVMQWKELGFTHVWLMGVWEVGPLVKAVAQEDERLTKTCSAMPAGPGVAEIEGSPFAIAGYRVPASLGGEAGLKRFRTQLRKAGMGLLLDFIPNHVGLDHPWLKEHPEYFVQAEGGDAVPGSFRAKSERGEVRILHGRDPFFPPWQDTAQLDLRRAETRAALVEELCGVARRCDGVRCDMAMLVLADVFARTWEAQPTREEGEAGEFWVEAIRAVRRRHRDFLLLGEVYWDLEARLQSLGFDYTYDKRLYDGVVRREWSAVQRHLLEKPAGFIAASAHFLENHDEVRVATILAPGEHRAAALMVLGLPGLRLLHEGQLEGACLQTRVHFGERPAETPQPEVQAMYRLLLERLPQTVVGTGEGRVLVPRSAWHGNPTHQNVVVIQWQGEPPGFDLVVVNLAAVRSQCYVPLSVPNLGEYNWVMKDLLGTEEYQRHGDDLAGQGLYLDVEPHAAQLFRFTPS